MGRNSLERVLWGDLLGVLSQEMVDKPRVIGDLPIDAIRGKIEGGVINRRKHALQAAGPILDEAEKEDIAGTAAALVFDLQLVRVPGVHPVLGIIVHCCQEKVVQQPDVLWHLRVEGMMRLQVVEEVLPLLAKPVCYVVPEALDARIVYAAPPNIRASEQTSDALHVGRDFEVFGAMIPPNAARHTVQAGSLQKQAEHARCSVVVVRMDAGDKSRLAIYEAVQNNFVLYEA